MTQGGRRGRRPLRMGTKKPVRHRRGDRKGRPYDNPSVTRCHLPLHRGGLRTPPHKYYVYQQKRY